jgi:putative AdoMet-dependent methyltransferase
LIGKNHFEGTGKGKTVMSPNTRNKNELNWIPENADNYDRITRSEHGIYYEGYNRVLTTVADLAKANKESLILDIASGTGTLASKLAKQHGCRVIGLDPSKAMIEKATKKAKAGEYRNIQFLLTENPFFEIPDFISGVDAIVTTFAFHHVRQEEKQKAIAEMARVLCQGGVLIIGDAMFLNRADCELALALWKNDLEEEYFSFLDTLPDCFLKAGLSFEAKQISRINWVVWGDKTAG